MVSSVGGASSAIPASVWQNLASNSTAVAQQILTATTGAGSTGQTASEPKQAAATASPASTGTVSSSGPTATHHGHGHHHGGGGSSSSNSSSASDLLSALANPIYSVSGGSQASTSSGSTTSTLA